MNAASLVRLGGAVAIRGRIFHRPAPLDGFDYLPVPMPLQPCHPAGERVQDSAISVTVGLSLARALVAAPVVTERPEIAGGSCSAIQSPTIWSTVVLVSTLLDRTPGRTPALPTRHEKLPARAGPAPAAASQ